VNKISSLLTSVQTTITGAA